MRSLTFSLAGIMLLAVSCRWAGAQAVDVDRERSSITVKVEKSGLFSAFAHNHTIRAPIASGRLDVEKRTAMLAFNTKEMKVLDEDVKESERAEIDQAMKSEKVLDVQRFPEISFTSTSITDQSGGHYQVRGNLLLHGTTRMVEFPISFLKDHYTGAVKLKQTDLGTAAVSIAGGPVMVDAVLEIVSDFVP